MGLSHEASAARLLTEQGRPRGHQGLGGCVHPQMVTEGPISHYPVTKEVPLLPPTFSSLVLPPRPTFVPPLLSGRGRENRRCWDCIIASITVIIYTSILSYSLFLARRCNQSRRVRSVQRRHAKEVQVVISEMTNSSFHKVSYFSLGGREVGKGRAKTSLNEATFFCLDAATRVGEVVRRCKACEHPRVAPHRGHRRGRAESQHTALTLL